MRRLILALIALSCAACATGVLPRADEAPAPAVSAAVEAKAVGGLTFSRPSTEDLRAMASPFGFSGNPILTIRPSIHGATSRAPKLENGNHELQSAFPSPFGDGWGVKTALTARVSPPPTGDIERYAETVIRPIVAAWAADGALYTSYSWMPDLGRQRAGLPTETNPEATASEASIVKNVGWPLPYVSPSRHEALFFYEAGVVLYVQWAEDAHTEATVPVSKAQAIETVRAALRDPAAQSEEARTGVDHFLGVPYAGVFPPPTVNYHDDLIPTFDVPDEVGWDGFLGTEFVDKPVWYIRSTWGGGGQVDALTGALIRFTRLRVGNNRGAPPTPFIPEES